MKWSTSQDAALVTVNDWYKNSDAQVCHLFGYAGTGKTTMAKHFAEGIDGSVSFGAFTGKAAHVLHQKGCVGASTIHSLIYHSRDKSRAALRDLEKQYETLQAEIEAEPDDERLRMRSDDIQLLIDDENEKLKQPFFILNNDSQVQYDDLVIIDECSMVDDRMGSDLLSFGTKVLVLGDPAQLPPVGGAGYFTENVTPDVMLTEIHRQAQESPIIRMATQVRNEEKLQLGDFGRDCHVVNANDIRAAHAVTFDQILVGRNATRHEKNRKVRSFLKITDQYPVQNDKLVCLRNNHDDGLLNGQVFKVVDIEGIIDEKVYMTIVPEDGQFSQDVISHASHFLGENTDMPWFMRKEAEEFDFGYAMTVHKSQGSQWDSVLLYDESFCFRKDRWRWLYTGITRAAEKVTVART